MVDDQLNPYSAPTPSDRANTGRVREPIDHSNDLSPAARGCLIYLGAKLGCLLLIVAFFLFAIFMAQFATFKKPE